MCLHGCIIFLQQYSACYGNYKADRDQCVDQSSASVLCSGVCTRISQMPHSLTAARTPQKMPPR